MRRDPTWEPVQYDLPLWTPLVTVTTQPPGNPSIWGLSTHTTKKAQALGPAWAGGVESMSLMNISCCPWADSPQGTTSPQKVWMSKALHRPRLGYCSSSAMHSTAHYRAWHVPRTHLSEAEKHALMEVRVTQLRVPWSLTGTGDGSLSPPRAYKPHARSSKGL